MGCCSAWSIVSVVACVVDAGQHGGRARGKPANEAGTPLLDFDRFIHFCVELWIACTAPLGECLAASYTALDVNRDGHITLTEFKEMVMGFDEMVRAEDAQEMFDEAHEVSLELQGDSHLADDLVPGAWVRVARKHGLSHNLSDSQRAAVKVVPEELLTQLQNDDVGLTEDKDSTVPTVDDSNESAIPI